jgi:hypothetical protein
MGTLFAQSADTVYVPANNTDGTPYVNSLIDKVVADTNSAGQQLHSVYKLERGAFYLIEKALSLRNPVKLVADPPVPNDPTKVPPKILSNINADGGTSTGSLIITWKDITLKNIWLAGGDLGGQNHGWGQDGALYIQDSLVTVTLDGIWCDYNSWSAFGASQPHTRWHINNMHARNEQNDGDQWTTFLFFFPGVTEIDTFIVTNSSYFQSNGPFFHYNAVVKYFKVDHCTFVNTYKHPFHQTQWLTAQITNNIFYNAGGLSMTAKENESQDPHGLPFGMVDVDTIFANSLGVPTEYSIPENERIITVKKNLWYYSPEITAYWAAHDTVIAQPFMNGRTTAMFANDAVWPGLVAEDNVNQDPLFNDFPRITEANAKFAQACTDVRAGSTHGWAWDGDELTDPTYFRLMIQYPTTENFKSYTGILGTDGKPLGDLSFYGPLSDVEKIDGQIPSAFELNQNYPNPFNPTTTISFTIPQSGHFTLKVFNVLGQEVATLLNGQMEAGAFKATFDASKLSSGMYIYRLNGENITLSKKMMLVK